MDGTATDPDTSSKNVLVSVSSLEGRQERGMDVEQSSFPPFDEFLGQDSHESCQTHDLDAGFFELLGDRVVESLATRVFRVLNDLRIRNNYVELELTRGASNRRREIKKIVERKKRLTMLGIPARLALASPSTFSLLETTSDISTAEERCAGP